MYRLKSGLVAIVMLVLIFGTTVFAATSAYGSLEANETEDVSPKAESPNYFSCGVLQCKNGGLIKLQGADFLSSIGYSVYYSEALAPNQSKSNIGIQGKTSKPYTRVYLTGVANGSQKAKDCIAWGKVFQ